METTSDVNIIQNEPEKIKNLVKRRHPDYNTHQEHWTFCAATYESELDWFEKNLFQYVKEGTETFDGRLKRAYRFNHTREVVDLTIKYLFKGDIVRATTVPDVIQDFRDSATINKRSLDDHMRYGATLASIYGRVYGVLDSNKTSDVVTRADEKAAGTSVYSYWITPLQALDFAFDDDGNYEWFLVLEQVREDDDPFESSGDMIDRYRLWGKNSWALYGEVDKKWGLIDSGEHGLGRVPVVPLDDKPTTEKYSAPALIRDVAYLDRAVANYLSNLDQIVNDQTFSQLIMPAQANLFSNLNDATADADGEFTAAYNKMVKLGTSQILLYDGEHGTPPAYISPDPKQASIIVEVITKIINEIYHSIGLAGERTKQDNSMGIDNSSGVAKAFDFDRVSSLLNAKARSLESTERQMQDIVLLYHSRNDDVKKYDNEVVYPATFDVRSMSEELALAADLATLEAPMALRKEHLRQLLDKVFPLLTKETRDEIETSIKSWEPMPAIGSSTFGDTQNKQGQVTDETDDESA